MGIRNKKREVHRRQDSKTLGVIRQSKALKEEPFYTSRVSKYTFTNTLQEQEVQLKTNPI